MDTKKLSKLRIKDFINDDAAGSRLQSLRLPRDLSLGGTKASKKIFKPNLNVVRNKGKVRETLKRTENKTWEKEHKSQNHYKQRFVQSTGVFSEGVGHEVRQVEKRASGYVKEKEYERPPTFKKGSWGLVDVKSEEDDLEYSNEDFDNDCDENEEKLPFVPLNWCAADLKVTPVSKEAKVEQEIGDSKVKTCSNILPREYIDNQPLTSSDPTISLWQLPDTFAFKNMDENVKTKKYIDSKLTDLPEGKIGKICIRKSGKIDVYIGDLKCQLEPNEFEAFTEELVALNVKSPPEASTAAVLGQISNRYQLNPDWTSLLC